MVQITYGVNWYSRKTSYIFRSIPPLVTTVGYMGTSIETWLTRYEFRTDTMYPDYVMRPSHYRL